MFYSILNYYVKRFPFPHKGWKYFRTWLRFTGLYKKTYCKKLHNKEFIYVSPVDHIQKDIFWYGYYEKEAVLIFEALLQKDSIVLDIGANIGYYSLIAASKVKEGRVYAFEPSAHLSKKIRENVSLNNLNNISIFKIAAGNTKEQILLHLSNEDNTGTTGFSIPYNSSGKTELVHVLPMDDWAADNNIESINIIKIDVEGYDKKVLEGLEKSIKKYTPIVFIEIVSAQLLKFNNTPAEIYDFFHRYNYRSYITQGAYILKEIQYPQDGYSIIFIPASFPIPSSIKVLPGTTSTHQ